MEQDDVEPARLMHNDPTTLLNLSDVRHISQAEQFRWFESVSLAAKSRRYAVREAETNCFIGLFRIDSLDLVNKSASVGLDIAREYRGRGLAKVIYSYFFQYLFMHMGLNRLELVTLATNNIALSLYRKLGFTEEGRLRKAIWRDGSYQDLLIFSILQSEYKAASDAK
jgi:RimJ/RimL family protein N-acetyltransferase